MKKMKKLIVAVMMMAAMAFVLCSCGGSNADGTYVPETVNGQDVATVLEAYKATGQGEMTAEQISKIVISGKNITISAMESIEQSGTCEVSGDKIQAVHMLPGYTHNIINLSETENLVTLMWANETFDPEKPDTFYEPV